MRPSDTRKPIRAYLVLPQDRLETSGPAFFYHSNPKTAGRFARHQHSRIDDSSLIALLTLVFGHLGPHEPLCIFSDSQFRSRWNALFAFFGLPFGSKEGGATPACLRGSSVTDFYIYTEDIPRAAWRGRWRSVSTLEYYLQEAAAQLFLSYLTKEVKDKLLLFSSLSDAVWATFTQCESLALWTAIVLGPSKPSTRKLRAAKRALKRF